MAAQKATSFPYPGAFGEFDTDSGQWAVSNRKGSITSGVSICQPSAQVLTGDAQGVLGSYGLAKALALPWGPPPPTAKTQHNGFEVHSHGRYNNSSSPTLFPCPGLIDLEGIRAQEPNCYGV